MRSLRRSCLRMMGSFVALVALAIICNPIHARPLVLEEQAKLTLPDTSFTCCGRVAISGNALLVTASKDGPPELGPGSVIQAAFVFERDAAGQWQFVTKLVEETHDPVGGITPISVAIDGSVAAVALKR